MLLMKSSLYHNQNADIRQIFSTAKSYEKILCVPVDFAKSKHVSLICDGHGEILRKPFPIHNSSQGVDFFVDQIQQSASRRKIPHTHIFIGGEDLPTYAENFLYDVASRGFLIVRVNALEAKRARENMLASSDSLDLLGIGKTMLAKRAVTVAKPGNLSPIHGDEIYRSIRELSRSRGRVVKITTATSNQIHTYVDRLFPGFLDSSKSGITPFSTASLELMKNEFSSRKIARKKPSTLARQLRNCRTQHPEETASKLIELAKSSLPPNPDLMGAQQRVLTPLVEQVENFDKTAKALKIEAAIHLASTPYAFLTSIRGIALAIANGMAGELGNPLRLPAVTSMCGYGGIAPKQDQTGGPGCDPKLKGTSRRCNRTFKYWVLQGAEKANQFGTPEWKDRVARWEQNNQHVLFASARRLLRLSKVLVCRQTVYQSAEARQPDATAEVRAADAEITYQFLVNKWQEVPNWQEVVFGEDKPLGIWRQLMVSLYNADLPLSKR